MYRKVKYLHQHKKKKKMKASMKQNAIVQTVPDKIDFGNKVKKIKA